MRQRPGSCVLVVIASGDGQNEVVERGGAFSPVAFEIFAHTLAIDCRRAVHLITDAADAAIRGAPRGRDAGDTAGDGDGLCRISVVAVADACRVAAAARGRDDAAVDKDIAAEGRTRAFPGPDACAAATCCRDGAAVNNNRW